VRWILLDTERTSERASTALQLDLPTVARDRELVLLDAAVSDHLPQPDNQLRQATSAEF
jgi:hypothetical protein